VKNSYNLANLVSVGLFCDILVWCGSILFYFGSALVYFVILLHGFGSAWILRYSDPVWVGVGEFGLLVSLFWFRWVVGSVLVWAIFYNYSENWF